MSAAQVADWVQAHPLSPSEIDCATTVMLKILDGKCKMGSVDKTVMEALYDAVKSDDLRSIYAVLGPGSGAVIFSGDRVADDAMRNDLVSAWDKSMTIDRSAGDAKATILVGPNGTPFPFPLVQGAGGSRP